MTPRNEIIKKLDLISEVKPEQVTGTYKQLLSCLHINAMVEGKMTVIDGLEYTKYNDKLDRWFCNCIGSLYYHPNDKVLILNGKQGIGKTHFFKSLFFDQTLSCIPSEDAVGKRTFMYTHFIADIDWNRKNMDLPRSQDFMVVNENTDIYAEKRLANYCGTSNRWLLPAGKTFLVIDLAQIDWVKFNNVNKLHLWADLHNIFKRATI